MIRTDRVELNVDFAKLWNYHPTHRLKVQMFGKMVEVARWQQPYILPYYFSGVEHLALPPPPEFVEILLLANDIVKKHYPKHPEFNSILVNWYDTGKDYISQHRDAYDKLHHKSVILTISLYDNPQSYRIMRITNMNEIIQDIRLFHGDIVMIPYDVNKKYYHGIPRDKSKDRRISLTFRVFV